MPNCYRCVTQLALAAHLRRRLIIIVSCYVLIYTGCIRQILYLQRIDVELERLSLLASSSLDSEPRSPPPDHLGDDDLRLVAQFVADDENSCGSQSDVAEAASGVPDLLLKSPAPDGAAAAPLSPGGVSTDARPATAGGKIDMHPKQSADVRKNCHVAVYKKSANGGYLDVDIHRKSNNSGGNNRFKGCCCVIL